MINDPKLNDVKIYCWIDSPTALCWMQRQQNWGTFVQNRVQEIRSLTFPTIWCHIPGTLNDADLVSRGCSGEHLLQGKWWEEPTGLLENEENIPKYEDEPDEDLVNSEKRKIIVTTLTKTDENVNWYCILPKGLVRDAAAFEIAGVDLAGPLYLKHGPKAYIDLYTCAVYRAIHLELITFLTTEAFFQSLRRFISRRGRPTTIYSDNGTNFKGAERLLHVLDWDSILARVEEKIQWKFNPPSAPWWGGWWERLVQMTKAILRKILRRVALGYEELITVLCDCERVINARPLTYVSEDVDDVSPLTPEMFLQEIPESGVPDIDTVDREKLSKRAKYLQKMRQQLRSKFRIEYLGQLRQQSIKNYKDKSLSVGEIVLLEDNSKKRAYWSLTRVLKLIPRPDGHKRLALIKTEHSEFLRPVQRLFRLELYNPVEKGE
ncbi:integrase catalytic domain-containing protein [Trichonephila clavipes]|nr:integrase catalytic domain-containing protein [Trichonephila clavipes]